MLEKLYFRQKFHFSYLPPISCPLSMLYFSLSLSANAGADLWSSPGDLFKDYRNRRQRERSINDLMDRSRTKERIIVHQMHSQQYIKRQAVLMSFLTASGKYWCFSFIEEKLILVSVIHKGFYLLNNTFPPIGRRSLSHCPNWTLVNMNLLLGLCFIAVGTNQGHFIEDTLTVLHQDLQPYVDWPEQPCWEGHWQWEKVPLQLCLIAFMMEWPPTVEPHRVRGGADIRSWTASPFSCFVRWDKRGGSGSRRAFFVLVESTFVVLFCIIVTWKATCSTWAVFLLNNRHYWLSRVSLANLSAICTERTLLGRE